MSEKRKFYLTKTGLQKIEEEYQKLLKLKKLKLKKEAPPFLHSEEINAEFVSFREDFEYLESRITELEYILKNFELIKLPPKNERDKVNLGATLKVELNDEIDEFTIVGTTEVDPANKKISDESPIGKALMGHRVGDTVVVKTEMINHTCKILRIKYNTK